MSKAPHRMITCPYNPAHQLEHYKMQVHLEKCRRGHRNSTKKVCPFDATHIVPELELDYHILICDKRGMFDTMRYLMDDGTEYHSTAQNDAPEVESEENWDTDNYVSYKPPANPERVAPNLLIKPKGLTPSERRKVRMERIKNYQDGPSS